MDINISGNIIGNNNIDYIIHNTNNNTSNYNINNIYVNK
jgi:hypothetical protein